MGRVSGDCRDLGYLGRIDLIADGTSKGDRDDLAKRSDPVLADRPDVTDAVRHGGATFASFIVIGIVPLVASLFPIAASARFPIAIVLTLVALFVVEASRTVVTKQSWSRGGLEMLAVGATAAVAYGIGALLSNLPGE
ncbi:MAG: VIT1/CCC1 transporter family protein [Chloroflexia bacterium]|nr:VIT1/CCC1 transporter family protein [Chloroflexia bacterium]